MNLDWTRLAANWHCPFAIWDEMPTAGHQADPWPQVDGELNGLLAESLERLEPPNQLSPGAA
jgi:hypothetical protein